MPKRLVSTPDLEVWTAGFWRTVWSLIVRRPEASNWLVVNKRLHASRFRLLRPEQDFLEFLAQHLAALEMAPDYNDSTKKERRDREQRVLAEGLQAILSARSGDDGKLQRMKLLNHFDFAALLMTRR